MNQRIRYEFESLYIRDLEAVLPTFSSQYINLEHIPINYQYNLDEENASIALSLFSLSISPSQKTRLSLYLLLASFRFLAITDRLLNVNHTLDDIDARVGCPRLIPKEPISISSFNDNEKECVFINKYITILWFIELLNTFITEDELSTRNKV